MKRIGHNSPKMSQRRKDASKTDAHISAAENLDRDMERILSKKGSDRIQVNNILCAVCVGALAILLGLSGNKLSAWSIGQLAIAIPVLVTSSLAYAKTCYRSLDEIERWDKLGWLTHTIGYTAIVNSVGLLLYNNHFVGVAWIYLGTVVALFVTYSVIDVICNKDRLKEKSLKLLLYLILFAVGFVVPITTKWVAN
jgi:hypothetical protein